jgi:hypothetical protein
MARESQPDLTHDFVLPTLLFAALGAMTWAVRGCSGFGGMDGCIFAGVTWGTAWWFIARDPGARQSRPYASGWIILALTVGIGFSGNRGWMQWPSFFDGHLQTNTALGQGVPIHRAYGFLWLFIAGVPWAGLGACLLAWCGSHRPVRPYEWCLRLACGIGAAWLAMVLFDCLPEVFLPLYKTMRLQYHDLQANPNLGRLLRDNRAAITHLGLYLGFLGYEMGRRDWRNVTLILTVGLVNGAGWALCQNWRWAPRVWPQAGFNWWRCWESCGGISIGIAYGLAHGLVNRRSSVSDRASDGMGTAGSHPNLERFGAYLGLLLGLGLSVRNGLKGWANIYLGNENYWDAVLWRVIGPLLLLALAALPFWIWLRPVPGTYRSPHSLCGTGPAEQQACRGDVFPHAYRLVWLVLLVQNAIAQLITGPHSSWNETAFSLYYLLLFFLSAVILHHLSEISRVEERPGAPAPAENANGA